MAEHTVGYDPHTTVMYNFEFTVPPQQMRTEEWIVHAHPRGDGLDPTANLTLSLSGNVKHRQYPLAPHDFAN